MIVGSSDSSGGAGIQADVRALAAVGCFCATAIVGVSAQAPTGVRRYWAMPPDAIDDQVHAIVDSFAIDAVKVGSLAFPVSVADALARLVLRLAVPLVLDPVIATAAGSLLCDPERLDTLDALLPVATVTTPNVREAHLIAGFAGDASRPRRLLAEAIVARGARAVLITGGEAWDGADWLLLDGTHHRIPQPTNVRRNRRAGTVHGAGCTHAATLCGLLGSGWRLHDAARAAKWQAARAASGELQSLAGVPVADARFVVHWPSNVNGVQAPDPGDSVREFFAGLLPRLEQAGLAGIAGSYRFEIAGAGTWTVRCREGAVEIDENGGEARCILRSSARTFLDVIRGQLRADAAFRSGEMTLDGDVRAGVALLDGARAVLGRSRSGARRDQSSCA